MSKTITALYIFFPFERNLNVDKIVKELVPASLFL